MKTVKILRTGVSHKNAKGEWTSPKVGSLIEVSDEAAVALTSEKFAELVTAAKSGPSAKLTEEV